MANSAESQENCQCCLKSCIDQPKSNLIVHGSERVKVKSFEPKKKKDKLAVNWNNDGSAIFHTNCWTSLVKATKNNDSLSVELTDVERSMIIEAKKTAEFFDSDSTVHKEAARIASILKNSKHCIAFTGAGISTAAGIADFRGPDGKWTERDRVKNFGASASSTPCRGTIMQKLRPTYTHEALYKLLELGYLKFIISQNTDGLHCLSGIPKEKIAELHGNSFFERCEDCHTLYELKHHYRKGKTVSTTPQKCKRCNISHRTGRKCTQQGCNGFLMNTIINFGDYLESSVLDTATHNAEMSDAILALGSSLKVSPANDLVTMGKKPLRLIICNRQTTPYDDECKLSGENGQSGSRVFCDCDVLMKAVMAKLLPASDLNAWEADRDSRMAEYALKRTAV